MPDPLSFLIFVSASVVALAIPGPTIALVITRSISDGRQVSIPLALGIGAGTLVGSFAAIAGAGAVLMASATAFTIVKWLGAAYLVYLGIKLLTAEPIASEAENAVGRGSMWSGFRDGFIVTLLNPKSIAFSAAFIPQFINPGGVFVWQATLLVVTFSVLATLNGLAFAVGTDMLRRVIRRVSVLRCINRLGGGFLIFSGVAGTFLKRPAV